MVIADAAENQIDGLLADSASKIESEKRTLMKRISLQITYLVVEAFHMEQLEQEDS